MDVSKIEITKEMMEELVIACLYREDEGIAIRKYVDKKITDSELNNLVRRIKSCPEFEQVKKDIISVEEAGLIDDDMGTIMLQYDRVMRKAMKEGKYEVGARILKEIRQLKAIENEQMKFEVVFKIKKPQED